MAYVDIREFHTPKRQNASVVSPADSQGSRSRSSLLGEQGLHDLTVHIGEAEIATPQTKRQLLVVDSEQMQHSGM